MIHRARPRWRQTPILAMFVAVGLSISVYATPRDNGAPSTSLARRNEAAAISKVALRKAMQGHLGLAAELYISAYQTDPTTHGYLYSAARALHLNGDTVAATAKYKLFLQRVDNDDPMAANARKHLASLRSATPPSPRPTAAAKKGADVVAAAPLKTPKPRVHMAGPTALPPSPRKDVGADIPWRSIGVGVTGVGVASLAIASYFQVVASSDAAALESKLDDGTIDASAARRELTLVENSRTNARIFLASGVVVGGVGAWLWLRSNDRPSSPGAWVTPVGPGGVRGFSVFARF